VATGRRRACMVQERWAALSDPHQSRAAAGDGEGTERRGSLKTRAPLLQSVRKLAPGANRDLSFGCCLASATPWGWPPAAVTSSSTKSSIVDITSPHDIAPHPLGAKPSNPMRWFVND